MKHVRIDIDTVLVRASPHGWTDRAPASGADTALDQRIHARIEASVRDAAAEALGRPHGTQGVAEFVRVLSSHLAGASK